MAFASHSAESFAVGRLLVGCAGQSVDSVARSEIEAAFARGVEATRTQEIEAYVALIEEGAVATDGSGGSRLARCAPA
jgi:hypothetical protein